MGVKRGGWNPDSNGGMRSERGREASDLGIVRTSGESCLRPRFLARAACPRWCLVVLPLSKSDRATATDYHEGG
ncbi:hypothetical protein NL676_030772 [Syzygium grande]|nr:hypothetical protein NL676_030772 [Syzygium grande]